MSDTKILDLKELEAQISDKHPCGEEMTFSFEFDEIKEAQREDDPSLAQGDWEHELKVADWKTVKDKSIDLLSKSTKDIQLTGWLTQSLGKLHGVKGLAEGFELTNLLLEKYWDNIFPLIEDDDEEERALKLEWYNKNIADVITTIPLAEGNENKLNMANWDIALDVENKSRSDAEYRAKALAEGKFDEAVFMQAVQATPLTFYTEIQNNLEKLHEHFNQFKKIVDDKLKEAPSFTDIDKMLKSFAKTFERFVSSKGGLPSEAFSDDTETQDTALLETSEKASPKQAKTTGSGTMASGPITSRPVALAQLKQIAEYFQRNEPHSPVSYLVNKAIKWGQMGLNDWLNEVIKDNNILEELKEVLGVNKIDFTPPPTPDTPQQTMQPTAAPAPAPEPAKPAEQPKPKSTPPSTEGLL